MHNPYFYKGTGSEVPSIDLGVINSFKTALNILRAVRAVALSMGDDDLTDYAIQLQAALIGWRKILPKDTEEQSEDVSRRPYL